MTSDPVYVWVWLPGATEPVVCGALREVALTARSDAPTRYVFSYGRSYLERSEAVPLYGLPLRPGNQSPAAPQRLPGAIRDGLPDAWGQRVIAYAHGGVEQDWTTCMLESGSNRFGALDFQRSAARFEARNADADLSDLAGAADLVEQGAPLPPGLRLAFENGTSIGGARPKVLLTEKSGPGWIAKLSSSDDRRPAVRQEALALDLARRCGLDVTRWELTRANGRDVLLVRRFDRGEGGTRRMTVSGLTMMGLDETEFRGTSYIDMLEAIRATGVDPGGELFARVAFSIVIGNTDDHARNHAAFWEDGRLLLTPAYDLDPTRSPAWDANQAMPYSASGERRSNLATLLAAAPEFGVSRSQGRALMEDMVTTVRQDWTEARNAAGLTATQAEGLLGAVVLNPAVLDGF